MNEAIRQVTHVQNIRYDKATERLYIIDQTLLPNEEKEIELRTVEEMIEICVPHMVQSHPEMSPEQAREMMRQFLPHLKRWK